MAACGWRGWRAGGLVLGLVSRGWLWHTRVDVPVLGQTQYFKYIYYSSVCRLDELLAGVALALLRNFHHPLWQRLTRHGDVALVAGCSLLACAFYWFLDDRYAFAITVFGYPLLALGFGLLLLAALDPASRLGGTRIPGCERLALWSYAIYLVHKPLSVVAAKPLAAAGYGPESLVAVVALMALSIGAGALLYWLVESPFMKLRARYFPA